MLVTNVYTCAMADADSFQTNTIGTLVRDLREKAELSQGQLAFKSGVNASHISLIERGLRHPKESTLQKLATALNVPLTMFTQLFVTEVNALELPNDIKQFEVMLYDTHKRNPRLARRIMRIGWELRQEEEENYKADQRLGLRDGDVDGETEEEPT